jgi:hypothetical protein
MEYVLYTALLNVWCRLQFATGRIGCLIQITICNWQNCVQKETTGEFSKAMKAFVTVAWNILTLFLSGKSVGAERVMLVWLLHSNILSLTTMCYSQCMFHV